MHSSGAHRGVRDEKSGATAAEALNATVWIVNHYAAHPSDRSGGTRHHSLARELARRGWKPTIIAASTDHGSREQRTHDILAETSFGDVTWLWVTCPPYARHAVLRVLNMVLFTIRLIWPRTTRGMTPPQVVIGSTVHPLAAWAGYRLARRHRVPFVFEVRDLWPETLIDMGAIGRHGLTARLMRRFERHLYRRAALIVTTMPAAVDYIRTLGIDPAKVVWISNGVDLGSSTASPPPMNDPFEFLYFGSHGRANAIEPIIDGFARATSMLGHRRISLRLVGGGPLKEHLIERSRALGLSESITFHDSVPKTQVPALASAADALVLTLLPLRIYRFGISLNKLFDYLASGRPVLFAGDPVNNAVRDADAGVCRPAPTEDAIAEAMMVMATSTEADRLRWGQNGRAHVEAHYSYSALAARLDDHLRLLIAERAAPRADRA